MPGFLYYMPGAHIPKDRARYDALIEEHGLSDVLGGTHGNFREVTRGPGDGPGGVILAPTFGKRACATAGYFPEKQRWARGGESENGVWVGVTEGERPGPDDLWRDVGLQTYAVTLRDGNTWNVPLALYCDGSSAVPQVYGIDGSGRPGLVADTHFERLAREAEPIFGYVSGQEVADDGILRLKMDYDLLFPLACTALGTTYRMGEAEICLLELLTQNRLWDIVLAVIGMKTAVDVIKAMEEAEKKNSVASTPDGSDGDCGETDD